MALTFCRGSLGIRLKTMRKSKRDARIRTFKFHIRIFLNCAGTDIELTQSGRCAGRQLAV